MNKTFEEFKSEIYSALDKHKPKCWRNGQFVFNYIDATYDVARDIQFNNHIDCYYNDNMIDDFINCAYKRLTLK